MKINIFRGDLTDVSAKKEALMPLPAAPGLRCVAAQLIQCSLPPMTVTKADGTEGPDFQDLKAKFRRRRQSQQQRW